MERVDCFHAQAEAEYENIRRLGYRQPVAIIPNGVYAPKRVPLSMKASGKRRLLFLARIHPIKGVDILLNAWKIVQEAFPEWELVVAGPDPVGYDAWTNCETPWPVAWPARCWSESGTGCPRDWLTCLRGREHDTSWPCPGFT